MACSSGSVGLGVHGGVPAAPHLGVQKGAYGVAMSRDGLLLTQDSCARAAVLSTG